jgi:hypothetical protein
VIYKKLLKQWEQEISMDNQDDNDSYDEESLAEGEDLDNSSVASSSPPHPSNDDKDKDNDADAATAADTAMNNSADEEGDSSDDSSNDSESDSSDSDDPQSSKRRKIRYIDDYDADDPFIDDEAIMDEDDDDMELMTDDNADVSDVLASFVATQGKVQHKKPTVNREQKEAEREEAKKKKQLAKKSKQYQYPEPMTALFDRLKSLQEMLSLTSDSKKIKRIPDAMLPALAELESLIQSSIPAKDQKLVYTRVNKYLPLWNQRTIRQRMKKQLKAQEEKRDIHANEGECFKCHIIGIFCFIVQMLRSNVQQD